MKYQELIDPELRKSARSFPFNLPVVTMGNCFQAASWRFIKIPTGVEEKIIHTPGYEQLSLKTSVFTPAGVSKRSPALIYIHGGAFAYNASAYHKKLAGIYAKEAACRVYFPHYHLSPKFPYPVVYEEVLSLYRTIAEDADKLDIDAEKIGLGGDSAGASIAALISNRCEEEHLDPPCLQMLVYPLTDADMTTDSMKRFTDTPGWNSLATQRMWNWYCGDNLDLRKAASPMHCELPRVIPVTYIETAEFDCLHDEGLLYAKKLEEAGASVTVNDTKGTFHGYDIAIDTQIVKRSIDQRISFLRKGFQSENI